MQSKRSTPIARIAERRVFCADGMAMGGGERRRGEGGRGGAPKPGRETRAGGEMSRGAKGSESIDVFYEP